MRRIFLPKLFLVVFIGSQVGQLSDGEQRGKMSLTVKLLDVLSIVVGIAVAAGTGWCASLFVLYPHGDSQLLFCFFCCCCCRFVWRATSEKIRHMQGLSEETDRLAVEALEDARAPLLHSMSQDSIFNDEDGDDGYRSNPLDEVLDKLTGRIRANGKPGSPDASDRV